MPYVSFLNLTASDTAQQEHCFAAVQQRTQSVDWSVPLDHQQAVTWAQDTIQDACPERPQDADSAWGGSSGCDLGDFGDLPEGASIDVQSYAHEFDAISENGDIQLDEAEEPCQDIPDECPPQEANAGLLPRFWIEWDLYGNQQGQPHAESIADLLGAPDLDAEFCARALGSSFNFDSHPRKRSIPAESSCCTLRRQLKIKKCGESNKDRLRKECYSSADQDCSQYDKKPADEEAVCRFIEELHVDLQLSNDYGSGTTDTVKVDFNEGQKFTLLKEQPWRNDFISAEINLMDVFGADRVPLKAIQKIDLWGFTAEESWWGLIRDTWRMQGLVLRAKCADRFKSGLDIEMGSFRDNIEDIHRTNEEDKEKTWSRSLTATNWTIATGKPIKAKVPQHDETRRRRRRGVMAFNATSE
ncbi:hypothetical protein CP533_4890 [Ophiocordyceps camponoti-saundersi (nom. inval.)]|nr:hypothetical protein CP533_4890 [Ophiocordyceps camponoti-saundersi (nom. inval.)]